MKTLLFASLIVYAPFSLASGNRVGNGGDIIQCKGESVLLDFYETTAPIKNFKSENSYQEIVGIVLNQLEKIHPAQAKQYKKRFASMEGEIEFRSEIELKNIKDSNHVFRPKNKDCKLLQIAVRRNLESTQTKRFVIDQELWKELNNTHKAGLILHEIIYEHLYKLGEEDSQKARILNAYLFSDKIFESPPEDYWKLIQSLKLPIYR